MMNCSRRVVSSSSLGFPWT